MFAPRGGPSLQSDYGQASIESGAAGDSSLEPRGSSYRGNRDSVNHLSVDILHLVGE